MPHTMEIVTPLGKDLLFHRMSAREEIGRLSHFEIDLLSKKGDINLDDMLGKNVTVKLELGTDKQRFWNGFVTRFAQGGSHGRYFLYRASVRPWLWFLTRTANCRIFQEMKVPDILRQVFNDHRIADVKFNLAGTYRKWEYCVQYRETDFNFVSRLMEQEGIYYYFNHQDGRHTMVLADSYGAHSAFDGHAEIPFIPPDRTRPEREAITDWTVVREVQPGRYALDDFYFEGPSVERMVKTKTKRNHELSEYEVYDYPGDYVTTDEGDYYVRTRLDELQAQWELARGAGNSRGVVTGSLFKMTGHPRIDQNREYLLLGATHELVYGEYEAMEGQGSDYRCTFTVLSSKEPFRTARTTPKPVVQGPQTAIVVGPKGDEIYTDKYGRVKVQFHWDRLGKADQNSSCWIRVSHPWAGKNWGMIAIPRIGQEVIVDFLEGDPDRPIITGRVYNAEQMPPYALPANMTQTGILTRSSKGGSGANANELRFEDKKGSEQVYLHAEKNQDISVENDETHSVGHDRSKSIGHDETTSVKNDRTETVGNNEKISIGVNRTESVGSNESISIGSNRTEKVGANESITIGANRTISVGASETASVALQRTHSVGVNETISVGAAQEITVGAAQAITVGAAQTITVGANQTESVGANQSVSVGANQSLQVGGNQSASVGGNQTLGVSGNQAIDVGGNESEKVGGNRSSDVSGDESIKAGKKIVLDAGDAVTITTGSASISMKSDGTITIKGNNITLEGSGKINIKASSDVAIKGSKVGIN